MPSTGALPQEDPIRWSRHSYVGGRHARPPSSLPPGPFTLSIPSQGWCGGGSNRCGSTKNCLPEAPPSPPCRRVLWDASDARTLKRSACPCAREGQSEGPAVRGRRASPCRSQHTRPGSATPWLVRTFRVSCTSPLRRKDTRFPVGPCVRSLGSGVGRPGVPWTTREERRGGWRGRVF